MAFHLVVAKAVMLVILTVCELEIMLVILKA